MNQDATFNQPAWAHNLIPTRLSELEGETEADVCVVGLGGSGLSAIHELLRLGVSVVGVDAGDVGGGAAGRNGGFLLAGAVAFYHKAVAALGRERARTIYQLTLAEIDRFETETPALVQRNGSLRLAASDAEIEDCDLQLAAMREDGLAVERYQGDEGRGLVFPLDGSFNPLARCRALAQRAVRLGASLYEQSRAPSIETCNVRTERGHIRCKHVIVAVDGGLERLLPELAGRVRTARLQMLSTAPAREVHIPRPVYSRWGYDYWQQLPDQRVVLGGGRDRFVNDEWTSDNTPTEEVQRYMESVLRDSIGVTQPVERRWAASVSYSDGVLPVMQQVKAGVWAIGAYNGTGNVMGSLYGRMIAQLVVTGNSEMLHTLAPPHFSV